MTSCSEIREALHERLDGPIPAGRRQEIENHLERCAGCREFQLGLLALGDTLRSAPAFSLPDEVLETVWARTIRAGAPHRSGPTRRLPRWAAAAAAVLVLAFLPAVVRLVRTTSERGLMEEPINPTAVHDGSDPAALTRAGQEARMVLAVTARALRRTERAAYDRVLVGEVSPAVRRIPIRWPEAPSPDSRRSGV